VAAPLRSGLVLDLDPGDADLLELAYRAIDRERVPPPRVDVDEQRQVDRAGDARRVGEDVAEVRQAEVRQSQRVVGNPGAGEIQGAEPGAPREHRGVGVHDPRNLERALGRHGLAQAGAGAHATTAQASGGMWTFTSAEPT
jgi:hypothetical protein